MQEILRIEHIVKSYPGVKAVDDVGFRLNKGEIMALLGENGAGKSTITKVICGAVKPDAGSIFLEGREVTFDSPNEAMKAGIGMVYQELSMVGNMSVAENIFMNRQPVNSAGFVDWRRLYSDTKELLQKFDIHIDPRTPVKNLSVGTCQLLEILKAISINPKVIILDEPTSSLTEMETALMFKTVQRLKAEGHAFIYISHKLSEIFQLADVAVIMRDGQYVASRTIRETNEAELVSLMVGREIRDVYGDANEHADSKAPYYFEVKGLRAEGLYDNIDFGIRKGEIVGVSGLIGAGRTEMALGIIGAHRVDGGEITLGERRLDISTPADAIRNKIAYLTEDRKGLGLYLNKTIKMNLIAAMLERFSRRGGMDESRILDHAKKEVEKYRIATPSVEQNVGNLSGGNQQKVLIAMWLGIDPEVIIFDEPTRGVDVGAKAEIYRIIKEHAALGKCVLLISSEMPELIGMSDRILVMREGGINGEISREEFSEENIIKYATGVNGHAEVR